MQITFFKPANSFSVFNKKSKPTLAECTKAEENLQEKINNVVNILNAHAVKHYLNTSLISLPKNESKRNSTSEIRNALAQGNSLAKILKCITENNTTATIRAENKEITKLTKLLDKYEKQTEKLENKGQLAKIKKSQEIVVAENKLDIIKLNSSLPEVVTAQEIYNKQEIAKISKTSKLLGINASLVSASAREKMGIIIEYLTTTPGYFKEEGIFRHSGSKDIISNITKYIDIGINTKEEIFSFLKAVNDFHCITGAIKEYFKLSLTTGDKETIQYLVKAHKAEVAPKNAPQLKQQPLPIQELLPFLAKIECNKKNLMTANSLARILAPQLQNNDTKKPTVEEAHELTELYIPYVEHLISSKLCHPVIAPKPSE
ncbi:RhoGAP domain-containing protein [Yersinia proxima]|uniref:RhoGAP domain-containing protein n=2 Tax=Yersinia proxima TaxID=2890316 RepID=UPI001D1250A7|nr:RhoGAP domain-containing protein [Yersinia proxima]